MTKENQDAEIRAGNDAKLNITVTDEDGNAHDITGATVEYIATAEPFEGTAEVTKDNDQAGGVTITDAPNGEVEVDLGADDTDDHGGEELFHQLHVTNAAGESVTVTEGVLTVRESNKSFA